jgi:hypothetical protein
MGTMVSRNRAIRVAPILIAIAAIIVVLEQSSGHPEG